jgi:hypothetical protein
MEIKDFAFTLRGEASTCPHARLHLATEWNDRKLREQFKRDYAAKWIAAVPL